MPTRRSFIRGAAMGAASLAAPVAALASPVDARVNDAVSAVLPPPPQGSPQTIAADETHWAKVAAQYDITPGVINLEGGYFGPMSRQVLAAHRAHTDKANSGGSFFARRDFPAIYWKVREDIAAFIGATPADVMIARNATDALHAIMGQYNKVNAGDTVMYADLDFNSMQWGMNELALRRGAKVVQVDIPEPATHDGIIDVYAKALDANPKTKLLLLTHCNNKTGLLTPVKEIAAIARTKGVDVVVDAAHSFGQVALTVADLDADFVGLNFHKWVGAPLGVGAMYIRPSKLASIDRCHGDEGSPITMIDNRLHAGTMNLATIMTVPDALAFQASIGIDNKAARLRYLRDRWVSKVRGVRGVDVLTPDDPHLVGAITGFRLHGRGDTASNQAITKTLLDEFHIFTFARTGLAKGDCVRVTPALYNSAADVDALAAAITKIAARD